MKIKWINTCTIFTKIYFIRTTKLLLAAVIVAVAVVAEDVYVVQKIIH